MENIKQIMLNIDTHLKEWIDAMYTIEMNGNDTSQGQSFVYIQILCCSLFFCFYSAHTSP